MPYLEAAEKKLLMPLRLMESRSLLQANLTLETAMSKGFFQTSRKDLNLHCILAPRVSMTDPQETAPLWLYAFRFDDQFRL